MKPKAYVEDHGGTLRAHLIAPESWRWKNQE